MVFLTYNINEDKIVIRYLGRKEKKRKERKKKRI